MSEEQKHQADKDNDAKAEKDKRDKEAKDKEEKDKKDKEDKGGGYTPPVTPPNLTGGRFA